jgi:hypothetical protein
MKKSPKQIKTVKKIVIPRLKLVITNVLASMTGGGILANTQNTRKYHFNHCEKV